MRRIFLLSLILFSSGCGPGLDPCPSIQKSNPITRCGKVLFQGGGKLIALGGSFQSVSGRELPQSGGCDLLDDGVYSSGSDCGFAISSGIPQAESNSLVWCVPGHAC